MADGGRAGASKQRSSTDSTNSGRLPKLAQWVAGGGSLRLLDRAGAGVAEDAAGGAADVSEGGFDGPPDAEPFWGDTEAERLDTPALLGGEDEGEDTRPGERLPVFRTHDTWRDPKTGEPRVTLYFLHSEHAHVRGECVLGQGSLWQEAAALSYLRALPHVADQRRNYDVRPALLLLIHASDCSQAARVIAYGRDYLRGCAARDGLNVSPEVCRVASMDALADLYRLRDVSVSAFNRERRGHSPTAPLAMPPAATRALELGIRKQTFSRLRGLASVVFARRLGEAERRFTAAANYTATPSGNAADKGYNPAWEWKPSRARNRERSPPPKR